MKRPVVAAVVSGLVLWFSLVWLLEARSDRVAS